MKKFAVLFLLLFFWFQSIAQNLSIGDMQTIYNLSNWDAVDVYLTKKGWQFEGSEKEANGSSMIMWTYKKNEYNSKANGWFTLTVNGLKFEELRYQLSNDEKYNLEKSNVSQYGYKFVNSQIENDELTSIYKNINFYLTLVVNKASDQYNENEIHRTIYMERIPKVIVETPVVKTPPPVVTIEQNGFIKDIDGNSYKTVKIGDQVWMAENLNVTKYNDGTLIPKIIPSPENFIDYPAMFYYMNDKNKYTINKFGALYNWYTVNTNKLCPIGWHVPNDDDWKILIDELGGANQAGIKMKSFNYWDNNGNGTTTSGFSGYPGGELDATRNYGLIGTHGYWWSSSEKSSSGMHYGLNCSDNLVTIYGAPKQSAFSVRCIKN